MQVYRVATFLMNFKNIGTSKEFAENLQANRI